MFGTSFRPTYAQLLNTVLRDSELLLGQLLAENIEQF